MRVACVFVSVRERVSVCVSGACERVVVCGE